MKIAFFLFFVAFIETNNIFNIRILTMNRPKSLERLLKSLLKLKIENYVINLEFFVDALPFTNINDNNTLEIIENFNWSYGKKELFCNSINMGLKNQWLRPYHRKQPLLILEDDLILCEHFMNIAEKSINFLAKKKKDNIFGISFQKLRLILIADNCKNFEPGKCLRNNVKKNRSFFLQQMATWAPLVYSEKWNELIDYYENSKKRENFEIHCVPGSIANLWYNTSGTYMQYFFHLKKYYMMYFNTEDHFAINFLEQGVHFKKQLIKNNSKCVNSSLMELFKFEKSNFFDNGFNRIDSNLKNSLDVGILNKLSKFDKCKLKSKNGNK